MKESWNRYHGGGIMEEEASGSHLEEPSGVSLVGSGVALGSQDDHRRPRALWMNKLSKPFCFTAFELATRYFV